MTKHAALIRFVWRVKENGRSGWLCFLDRWKNALGTSLSEDLRGCDVMIIVEESQGIALIGGETTQRENYGGGSSNRVASNVAEEEVVNPGKVEMEVMGPGEVEMVMNVNEIEDCGRSSSQDHLDYEGECWVILMS
ncbi:hypothetical protein Tco_0750866 [Tanacetum coccineum]|uniref:Uncharacterized protein n=1 Tax=Tanacetum coccineum TaxID=301880 RepID=A0ABQ4Z5B6_9ASTR